MEQTRGARNNNPFNIIKNNVTWIGQVQNGSDDKFCQFKTMELGIRAGLKLLVNYNTFHALITPEQIITRFAPPSENNTQKYINFVKASLKADWNIPSVYKYFYCIAHAICFYESRVFVEYKELERIASTYRIFYGKQLRTPPRSEYYN